MLLYRVGTLEGLLTTKWIIDGDDQTVADFNNGIY